MRYKKLYNIAKEIDETFSTPNKNKIIEMLERKRIDSEYITRGNYNRVFLVKLNKRLLMFKVGKNIKYQYGHYLNLKYSQKLRYAKCYWVTRNCMLQKCCKLIKNWSKKDIKEMKEMKKEAKKRGYSDVRGSNIGKIGNKIYVFDLDRRYSTQGLQKVGELR